MNIAIIGTGYVGLVTGACLASMGNEVHCCDIDEAKIGKLRLGEVPFYEPNLEPLILEGVEKGRLHFTTETPAAIAKSDVVFIAVGTPPSADGSPDMSQVWGAAQDIAAGIRGFTVVATKSTVPIGTTQKVREIIADITSEEFAVASNPEFLKEGNAVNDFLHPDRVVVGIDNDRVKSVMQELYTPFVTPEKPLIFMDIFSSELTKYAANSLLATKVSFINEIANICEVFGADVEHVRMGIGYDKRIGFQFLKPGIGFGGSCFPKDIRALDSVATAKGYQPELIRAVHNINQRQRRRFFDKIDAHFEGDLAGRSFAVWGLSFKPQTDDIREAPALAVIDLLLERGANIRAYDPEAMPNVRAAYGDRIGLVDNYYDALRDADALVINTEWNDFRTPDFDRMKSLLKNPVVFDGRNLYSVTKMRDRGFTYHAVGLKF